MIMLVMGALLVLGSSLTTGQSLTVNDQGVEVVGFLWIGRSLRCFRFGARGTGRLRLR